MKSVIILCLMSVVMIAGGCGSGSSDNASTAATAQSAAPASGDETKINEAVSKIINDATTRFSSLDYAFNEDLLKILDQFANYYASTPENRKSIKLERQLPKLDQLEELSHFEESIIRWEKKSGKSMRSEVDRMKSLLAKRNTADKQSQVEFNKEFSAAFDDFVKIEVDELRERRNRWIHDKAKPAIDELKATNSTAAGKIQATLNAPPYNLPPG